MPHIQVSGRDREVECHVKTAVLVSSAVKSLGCPIWAIEAHPPIKYPGELFLFELSS